MVGLTRRYATLKLTVNTAKSAVTLACERSFLGYGFWTTPEQIVQRKVSPKAMAALKARLREFTSRSGDRSLTHVVALLRSYLVGWKAYFRLTDTPLRFAAVDQWRRLRMLLVTQQKRGTTLFRTLRARKVSVRLACEAAAHCTRWWAMAAHAALHTAYPIRYFHTMGVPCLGPS